jgi:dienelactone hydrolase
MNRAARCCLLALPLITITACKGAEDPTVLPDRCSTPAPRLGTEAAVEKLVSSPAQCGQAAHSWLRSEQLGEIVQVGPTETVPAAVSRVALTLGKVPIPAVVHDTAVEQIEYMTQDRGVLIKATAMMAYPTDLGPNPETRPDVLLLLHGTSGFTDGCGPSKDPQARSLVSALSSLGYVVVAPDYIGLRGLPGSTGFAHPYLAAQPTAIASLDAVRAAARRLGRPGEDGQPCASARFATVGGSQGGHAALWVDRLWPYYAPELTQVGVVATVPPADLVGEGVRALQRTVPASANMAAFFAATSDWYGLRGRLGEVFRPPLDKELPAALAKSCDPSNGIENKKIEDVFQPALLAAANRTDGLKGLDPWGCLAVENGLTTTSVRRIAPAAPGYGVLFVLGEKDTLVDPETERRSFDTLCGQGMEMQYLECAGASHTRATTWALPEIIEFLTDRYAGKPVGRDLVCKRGPAVRCKATN